MFVRTWMTAPAVVLPADTSAVDALEVMTVRAIRRIPVVDGGRLVGIVTRAQLLEVTGPEPRTERQRAARLADLMARPVLTVSPDDTLEHASRLMLEQGVSGLPVFAGGAILGLITESDVFRAFNEIMGTSERGARLVMTLPEGADLAIELLRRLQGLSIRSLATYRNPAAGTWEIVVRVAGRPETARGTVLTERQSVPHSP